MAGIGGPWVIQVRGCAAESKREADDARENGFRMTADQETGKKELIACDVEHALEALGLGKHNFEIKALKRNLFQCTFNDRNFAEKSIRELDGSILQGFPLEVNRATPSEHLPNAQESFREVGPCSGAHPTVPGLYIFLDFLTEEEEQDMIDRVLGDCWETSVHRRQPKNRRVQHYGYKFDYGLRRCDMSAPVKPYPEWLLGVTGKIDGKVHDLVKSSNGRSWKSDQLTINEYLPGQGIAQHVDTHSAFEDGLTSLSLGSSAVIRFCPFGRKDLFEDILLPRRSLLVMTGKARYSYTHGIIQRKSDNIKGLGQVLRNPRWSLTFRQAKPEPNCENCPAKEMCDL